MHKRSYYIVNGITIYRLAATPFLLLLVYYGQFSLFKWLLALSFCTDMIDGYLARKFRVVSVFGAKMDSIADDLTVVVGCVGLFLLDKEFIYRFQAWIILLFSLFIIQVTAALIRYKMTTSFHTYLAKTAALVQGSFLMLSFFLPPPCTLLFFITLAVTALELIEEIIMVILLPEWKADVKSLIHALRLRKKPGAHYK